MRETKRKQSQRPPQIPCILNSDSILGSPPFDDREFEDQSDLDVVLISKNPTMP